MAVYSLEKFDKLIINPFGKDDDFIRQHLSVGELLIPFDGARLLESFRPKKDLFRTIRYIIYMYDIESPLAINYPSVDLRKQKAAELAGYDIEEDHRRLSEEIYQLTDPVKRNSDGDIDEKTRTYELRDLVLRFIRHQNHTEWAQLITNEDRFWKLNAQIMMEDTDFRDHKTLAEIQKIKTFLTKELDEIGQRIKGLRSKIFKGDTVLDNRKVRMTTSPEAIAKRFRDKKK